MHESFHPTNFPTTTYHDLSVCISLDIMNKLTCDDSSTDSRITQHQVIFLVWIGAKLIQQGICHAFTAQSKIGWDQFLMFTLVQRHGKDPFQPIIRLEYQENPSCQSSEYGSSLVLSGHSFSQI
jgi:hypothetical protein